MKLSKKSERDMIRELDAYFEEARRGLLEESSKLKTQPKSSSKTKKQTTVKNVSS